MKDVSLLLILRLTAIRGSGDRKVCYASVILIDPMILKVYGENNHDDDRNNTYACRRLCDVGCMKGGEASAIKKRSEILSRNKDCQRESGRDGDANHIIDEKRQ